MAKVGLGGKLGTLKTHNLTRCVAKEVMTFTWSGKKEDLPLFPSMEKAKAAATEVFKVALKAKRSKKAEGEAEKAEKAKKAEAEKAERAKKVAKQADELKKAEAKKAEKLKALIDASPAA